MIAALRRSSASAERFCANRRKKEEKAGQNLPVRALILYVIMHWAARIRSGINETCAVLLKHAVVMCASICTYTDTTHPCEGTATGIKKGQKVGILTQLIPARGRLQSIRMKLLNSIFRHNSSPRGDGYHCFAKTPCFGMGHNSSPRGDGYSEIMSQLTLSWRHNSSPRGDGMHGSAASGK